MQLKVRHYTLQKDVHKERKHKYIKNENTSMNNTENHIHKHSYLQVQYTSIYIIVRGSLHSWLTIALQSFSTLDKTVDSIDNCAVGVKI